MNGHNADPDRPRQAEAPRFTERERAAIAAAVAKIVAGAAAQRAQRRFEDDPAAFAALLREAAERR